MWPHGDSVGDAVPQQGIYRIFVHRIRLCYIPEQVIVRKVESVLNADDEKNNPEADRYFRERIPYALGVLKEYALALIKVHESGTVSLEVFKNGM
jgi:hypothetical protein